MGAAVFSLLDPDTIDFGTALYHCFITATTGADTPLLSNPLRPSSLLLILATFARPLHSGLRRRASYHAGGAPLRLLSHLGVSLVAGGTDIVGL